MSIQITQYTEAYHASFQNRNIVYQRNKMYEKGVKFRVVSVLYTLSLIVKVVLSSFYRKVKTNDSVFVSWNNLHTKLASRIQHSKNVITISRDLSKQSIALYKNVSLIEAFKVTPLVYRSNPKRSKTGFDNIIFCFAFALEFQMLHNLVAPSNKILMAGQLDRYSIMLSILARDMNKRFCFVQHGVNNFFEGLYKLRADDVYYLFEISIPFFHVFLKDVEKVRFIPIPSIKPDFKKNDRYKNAIAFASQIIESDLVLLDIMTEHYKGGDILIYPHPTEKTTTHFQRYVSENVHITMERISNLKLIVSTGSTLGLEYDLLGVTPVFINLNNVESEVFRSNKYLTFNDLTSFREWFINDFTKANL